MLVFPLLRELVFPELLFTVEEELLETDLLAELFLLATDLFTLLLAVALL